MNFITDSLPPIAYCGHSLININCTSVVAQKSSVKRRKGHINWGLTRCQTHYLLLTFSPHNSPMQWGLRPAAVDILDAAEAPWHMEASWAMKRFAQGVQDAEPGWEVSPRDTIVNVCCFSPTSMFSSLGNNVSWLCLEMPSSSMLLPHPASVDPGPGIPKWLIRTEHMIQADLIGGTTHGLAKPKRLQSWCLSRHPCHLP